MDPKELNVLLRNPEVKLEIARQVDECLQRRDSKERANSKAAAKRETRKK